MNKFYKEDFSLSIRFSDYESLPKNVPDVDFSLKFVSGPTAYVAGRFDGILKNCSIPEPDVLVVNFDNHNLLPTSDLQCFITWHLPDNSMPDHFREVTKKISTGVCLSNDNSDPTSSVEINSILPYIKGDKGDKGDPGPQGPQGDKGDPYDDTAIMERVGTIEDDISEIPWVLNGGNLDLWILSLGDSPNLKKIYVKNLSTDINLSGCPSLLSESVEYMIAEASNDSPITIILHPNVLGRLTEELIQSASEKKIALATL